MLPPARCPSCNHPVGQYAAIFRHIRAQRTQRQVGQNRPKYVEMEATLDVSMGDVLDLLGLSMECCRTVLVTDTPLRDVY